MSTQTIIMGSVSGGFATSALLTSTSDAPGAIPLYVKEEESTVFSLSGDQITFENVGTGFLTVYYLDVSGYLDASLNVSVETFPIDQTITMDSSISGEFLSSSFLTSSTNATSPAVPSYSYDPINLNPNVFSISGDNQIIFGEIGTAILAVSYLNVVGYNDATRYITVQTIPKNQTITMGAVTGAFDTTLTLTAFSDASGITPVYTNPNPNSSPLYTLSGDQISFGGEIGTASITVTFPSVYGYNEASLTVPVTITKKPQTITMADVSGNYNSSTTLYSLSTAYPYLNASPYQYININNSDVYSISGDEITFEKIGTATLVVYYLENSVFMDASLNITVETLELDQNITAVNIQGNYLSSQPLVSSSDVSGATASYTNPNLQNTVYSISGDTIFFTGIGMADLVVSYEKYGYKDASMNISVTTEKIDQQIFMNDVSGDFASSITLISSSTAIGTYSPIYSGQQTLSGDTLTFGEIGTSTLQVLYQVYGYNDASKNVLVESRTATQQISMSNISGDFLSSAILSSSSTSGATPEYVNETASLVYTLSGNQIIFGEIGTAPLTVYYRSVYGYYDASMDIMVETQNKAQTITPTSNISGIYKSSQTLQYTSDASASALPEYVVSNNAVYTLSGNNLTFAEVGTASLVLYFRNFYGYLDTSLNITVETTPNYTYSVTVSGGVFHLDGIPKPAINFEESKTYLFDQSDVTNEGFPLIFGKLPDTNIVEEGVTTSGTPGQAGAYSLIKTPSDFLDPLFYFDAVIPGMGTSIAYDFGYSLGIVYQPDFGRNKYAFSLSTQGGAYYTQPNITFTSPNKYYFDVSQFPSSSFFPVFGTQVDVSSTVYSGTVRTNGYILLDLTNYTGSPLKMFERTEPGMGYVEPTISLNTYVVSMSNDQLYIYLDGIESPLIDFQPNETYLFLQDGATNQNYQIMFSQIDGMMPYYYGNNSYSYVGTLGQPGAYTQITIPSDFSGTLYYFLKSYTHEYKYDVKVQQNYLGQSVYALNEYNQKDISLAAPHRYFFSVDASSNSSYVLDFKDLSSSYITRGRTPGTSKAFVLLDLTTYQGPQLFYQDRNVENMGYYETVSVDAEYIVTVSGSTHDFYIDGTRYPPINFKAKTSKFDQSDPTNANHQLYFSTDPYSVVPFYDVSVQTVGTPGFPNGYSTVTVPSDFSGNLYIVNQYSTVSRTSRYFVKRLFNAYNQPTFAFSSSFTGPYYNQVDLSFNGPTNQYLFEYYWDMNNPTANTHSYSLVFGTQVDVSSTIYSGTVHLETPGLYRSAVYLDLSGYTQNSLYAFNATTSNMGYSPPPDSPDFTYMVTVSGEEFCLDGIPRLAIDFDANKTYLFIQSDPTNVGFPMIFGKLPNDAANIVQNGIKIVGSLGQPNAYTLVTTPSDFMDSLFYFHTSLPNKGPAIAYTVSYVVKRVITRTGASVFSISTSGDVFYNQPAISFTGPNKYYFNVADSTNTGYELVFGTQVDVSSSIYSGTMYDQVVDGNEGAFVFLDLTDYIGLPLFLFERNTTGMGYTPAPSSPDFSYNVTISGNSFVLNGTERLFIDFDANKTYLFDQSNSTNISGEGDVAFGKLPDDTSNLLTTGISFVGTPGRPGAYTFLSLPSTYLDSLFYFHPSIPARGPTTPYDVVYYVKTQVVNDQTKQFVISQSSGGPYQPINFDTSFSSPNKYYFNVADSTNTGFQIVFGTERDISSSIYRGTVYNQNDEGSTGSFVYLDLNDYPGAPLYLFESVTKGMGYTFPEVTANTYTMVLDISTQIGITLSGNFYPNIDFTPGETYVFTQNSSTNANSQLVFGTTLYSSEFYTTGVTYSGTPGINGSYTQIKVPMDFSGTLYYYTAKSTGYNKYFVKVDDGSGNPQFSFSQTEITYTTRPNLSFSSPNQYLFNVSHTSNVGNVLSFGTEIETPISTFVTRLGTLGSSNAMVVLDLSGSANVNNPNPYQYFGSANSLGFHYTVSGYLDSYDLLTAATSVYYVKVVQNSLGANVYAFSTSENGTYYNQSVINLVAPNTFLFITAHSSNIGFKMVFGTDLTAFTDPSKQYTETTYRIRNAGETNANIYLDLSTYTGKQLYYFDSSYANMGYIETRAMPKVNQYLMSSSNTTADQFGYVTASSDKVAISTDLNNWTVYDISQTYLYVIKTIAANDSIILVGGRGLTCSVAWSTDGKIWNPVTSIPNTTVANMGVSSIIWNGGAWVLMGMTNSWATQFVYTSLDGKNWTVQNMSAVGTIYGTLMTSNNSNNISYPNGKIFIPENQVGNNFILGTYSLTSPTAITWSRRPITPFTGSYTNTSQVNFMGNCFYSSGSGPGVYLKINQDTLLNDTTWIPNEILTAGSNDNEMVFFAEKTPRPIPITFIETAASGATLVLNLDSRNESSLARTGTVTTWYDLTANDNDATIYGSVAYGSLGGQNCALFPGDNASYVQARSGVYFTGSSFTVQSWVYVTQVRTWIRIFDFGNGAGSNNVLMGASYGGSGTPGVYIEGQQFQSTHPGVGNAAWHYICLTFNYVSGSSGTATIYVDGLPYGQNTLPKPANVVRNICYIGRSNWGFGDPNLYGGMGSLQIYNGLLTGEEILRNYNTTKSSYGL